MYEFFWLYGKTGLQDKQDKVSKYFRKDLLLTRSSEGRNLKRKRSISCKKKVGLLKF